METVIQYRNYRGPQGNYGVVDGQTVVFTEDAAYQMAHSAHLLALGAPEYAEAMTQAHLESLDLAAA